MGRGFVVSKFIYRKFYEIFSFLDGDWGRDEALNTTLKLVFPTDKE